MTEEDTLHLQLYAAFREYIKHEDELINNRLNWNFTIQGFLFTAYAFAFQKTAELWNTFSHGKDTINPPNLLILAHALRNLHGALLILASVGVLVGTIIVFSVSAADIAIKTVDERWRDKHPEYNMTGGKNDTHGENFAGLPGMVGGGNPRAADPLGFQAARFLPWICILAWVALAINSVIELARIHTFLSWKM